MKKQIMCKTAIISVIMLVIFGCSKDDDGNSENNNPSTKISLPVKITRKNASGDVVSESTYTYDAQKRRKTIRHVDTDGAYTQTASYENGKITEIVDYDDPEKAIEKFVNSYNANGMVKEEIFLNNILFYVNEWFHRPDGGLEKRVKNIEGGLVQTWYCRFNSTGNIERVVLDHVNPTLQDEEYTYGGFDNKQRVAGSYMLYVLLEVLMDVKGTMITAPNNQTTFTKKQIGTGNLLINRKMEYTYNTKGQVTQTKVFRASDNALVYTDTIEYQEF